MRTQQFIKTALILSLFGFISVEQSGATTPASKELKTNYVLDESNFEETDLVIEDWMSNDAFWNKTSDNNNSSSKTSTDEGKLNIEEWMNNDNYWMVKKTTMQDLDHEQVEKPLEISEWMISDNYWK